MNGLAGADESASGRPGRRNGKVSVAPVAFTTELSLASGTILMIERPSAAGTKRMKYMKKLISIRSKSASAGLAFVLAFAISGNAAVLHVPIDYSTIQVAVNAAASGDEIQIASGVYAGQVLISNKSLTLMGSAGTVLRATSGMSQPFTALGSTLVPLLGILRSEVVVSNLTFEGEHLADTYSPPEYLLAIYYLGSGGRVEDCRIMGFRGSNLGDGSGVGLRVSNPVALGTSSVTIQILRNTFADNLYSIALAGDSKSEINPTFDPTLMRTAFVVSDNTITGNGPDATGVQDGIDIYAGATGEVSRNTISDHAYVGTTDPTPYAVGVEAYDALDFGMSPLAPVKPIRFEGNVLRNNQLHLLVLRGDGNTIVNNSFEGTAPGARPGGLYLSGENVMVGTNRFSNMDTGIVLFGDDPEYGTYLGIASNATLIANGFCNVATNYVFEPLTTYDPPSTLTCPEPTLDIRAVQLSWPYSYNGYSVETAINVNGPWTPSDTTVFLQDGQNSVVIPAESDQRYFRLAKP
jgi:hypothetical protein